MSYRHLGIPIFSVRYTFLQPTLPLRIDKIRNQFEYTGHTYYIPAMKRDLGFSVITFVLPFVRYKFVSDQYLKNKMTEVNQIFYVL